MPPVASRTVDVADAFTWLPTMRSRGPVVAVLPDPAEIDMGIGDYPAWFARAVRACLAASTGPTVFLQTDRIAGGRWTDKAALAIETAAAAGSGHPLLWHKIVLRRSPGRVDLHRPTYSHVVAFGPGRPGTRTPDVIHAGRAPWRNGIGADAALMIVRYMASVTPGRPIVNPFCGHGTLLAAANAIGVSAHGCELDPDRAVEARKLNLRAPTGGVRR